MFHSCNSSILMRKSNTFFEKKNKLDMMCKTNYSEKNRVIVNGCKNHCMFFYYIFLNVILRTKEKRKFYCSIVV